MAAYLDHDQPARRGTELLARRSSARPRTRRRATSRRPSLESLEPRVVLSATVYTVNSTGSGAAGTGTSGTLPYVISQADTNTNTDGSAIEFDPTVFSSPQSITLTATLDLSETPGLMVIEGPGADRLTISGGNAATVFTVESGVTASLSGLTISGGSTTGGGGGLYNAGTATLTDCTISGNSAKYGGGAYDYDGAKLTLTDCTISGNSATKYGGGLEIDGTVILTGCTIDGNQATGAGGGLDESGTADGTLTDCTISGNSTQADGGGTYAGDTVKLALINCTLSGNYAQYSGGGASVGRTAELTLTGCTVSGNYAGTYGGLYAYGGTAELTNTIVAGNSNSASHEDDIGGTAASAVAGNFNLIGPGGSGGINDGSDGNIVLDGSTDPGLAPLGEYGGSTQTIALLPGSPALGAGTAVAGVTTDQRGEPLASAPDIGAFQSQGFSITRTGHGTPQQTTDGTAFPNALSVVVTAKNPAEPVAGGIVTFSAPSSGASAGFSTDGATIDVAGSASILAADNSIPGSYAVTATVVGAAPVSFSLTNLVSSPILNYTVNSASGNLTGSGSSGTLPYVVFLANANADTSSNGNTIQFDPSVFSTPQTITLGATLELSETSARGDRRARGRAPDRERKQRRVGLPGGRRGHGEDLGPDDKRRIDDRGRRAVQRRHGHAHRLHAHRQLWSVRRRCIQLWYGQSDPHRLHTQWKFRRIRRRAVQRRHGHAHRLHDQRQLRHRWWWTGRLLWDCDPHRLHTQWKFSIQVRRRRHGRGACRAHAH